MDVPDVSWKLFCLDDREQMTQLGERFVWGVLGLEETIQNNYKMNFIKESFQRFPQTSSAHPTDSFLDYIY